MCGIVGYVDHKGCNVPDVLQKMMKALEHRGPDDEGANVIKAEGWSLGLGHRRLSIIDLSPLGHQPMRFRELSIVFNGEIYNYSAIKKELEEKQGCSFSTHTDTEVILQAFYQWGIKCLDRFIGMFAFGLYDGRSQKLFLVRDRAGVKPLFYYERAGLFLFGSELKAFHQHPGFQKKIDKKGLGFFLQYGYLGAPHSIFEDTGKVLPGHYLEYDLKRKKYEEKKYWDVFDFYNKPKLKISFGEAKKEMERILQSAFNYRMVSDVPVGVFLSGGYDSSAVTALLQKDRTEKIRTFTIGFEENRFNEAGYARQVASHLGTRHREYYCTERDAIDLIPLLPYYFDEPFGDASAIPTMLVSKIAREEVKVALSADGGDESFAGYVRYQNMQKSLSRAHLIPNVLRRPAGQALKALNAPPFLPQENYVLASYSSLLSGGASEYNKHYWKQLPDSSIHSLIPGMAKERLETALDSGMLINKGNDELTKMMALDYKTYLTDYLLTKVDRATMAVSLEGREPMLDHRIIEFAAQLPLVYKYNEGIKKRILKDIAWTYIPKNLLERPKMGFFLPIKNWLKSALKDQVYYYLDPKRIIRQGLFDPVQLEKIKRDFMERRKDHLGTFIWFMLMFQMWYDKWMTSDTR